MAPINFPTINHHYLANVNQIQNPSFFRPQPSTNGQSAPPFISTSKWGLFDRLAGHWRYPSLGPLPWMAQACPLSWQDRHHHCRPPNEMTNNTLQFMNWATNHKYDITKCGCKTNNRSPEPDRSLKQGYGTWPIPWSLYCPCTSLSKVQRRWVWNFELLCFMKKEGRKGTLINAPPVSFHVTKP